MAKYSEKPRTHIKDIFATVPSHPNGVTDCGQRAENDTTGEEASMSANQLVSETSPSNVFFVKKTINDRPMLSAEHSAGEPERSTKNRPAPKAPEPGRRQHNGREPAEKTGPPTSAGQQLAGEVTTDNISSSSQPPASQECRERKRNLTSNERSGYAKVDGTTQLAGHRPATSNTDLGCVTADKQTANRPPPAGCMDTADPEDNATSASVLSDSGTTSISSGYTSDILDTRRQAAGSAMTSGRLAPDQAAMSEDEFDEDECILDFDEEEEDEGVAESSHARHTLIYKEYRGEDFARYLEDDQESGLEPTPVAPPRRSRYAKRTDTHSLLATSSTNSTLDLDRKKGFRHRFSQIFTLSKQHKNVSTSSLRKNSIQNFSFADSKMGEHITASGSVDHLDTITMSEVGLRQAWSATDTLAVRTLKKRPDIQTRPKRSSSVGDILDSSASEYKEDFESRRKSQMYDPKLVGKNGKKSNIWAKLGKSRKKRTKSKYDFDNTTDNPLMTSASQTSAADKVYEELPL